MSQHKPSFDVTLTLDDLNHIVEGLAHRGAQHERMSHESLKQESTQVHDQKAAAMRDLTKRLLAESEGSL